MRILLQFPEGLKTKALEIAKELEKEGNTVIISIEPCYGACDLRINEAKLLKCDKIIHLAHTRFLKSDIPVEYIELREKFDASHVLEKLEQIKFERIGIVASLQFIDFIDEVKKYLESKGKHVFVGDGKNNEKFLYPGQILGCDFSEALKIAENVECFLVLSSGKFHALGIALKTKKPVFLFDLERGKLEEIDTKEFVKRKIIAQELAKECKKIGILVSTKPGQENLELAINLKKKIEEKGKEVYILVADEIKPEKVEYLGVECLINTACPRIAIEERTLYHVPILNPDEFEEILEE